MRDTRGMNCFASVLKEDENEAQSISQKSPMNMNVNTEETVTPEKFDSPDSNQEIVDKSVQQTSDSGFNDCSKTVDANVDTEMVDDDELKENTMESEKSAKMKTVQIELNDDDDDDLVGDENGANELNNELSENNKNTFENNENDEIMETTEERSPNINGNNDDDNNGDELESHIKVDDDKRTESSPIASIKKKIPPNEKSFNTNKRKISISSVTDHSPPAKK